VKSHSDQLTVIDFETVCPQQNSFKKYFIDNHFHIFKERGHVPFPFDAPRFAHKVFAIDYGLRNIESDLYVWLDSDLLFHRQIDKELIAETLFGNSGWSFLGRDHLSEKDKQLVYPECGFMLFDKNVPGFEYFWEEMSYFYEANGIYGLREWHDSFAFEQAYKKTKKKFPKFGFNISSLGLEKISDPNHVFIASKLGEYMDHRKGNRKSLPKSPELEERQS
jgi:hypothetical protein